MPRGVYPRTKDTTMSTDRPEPRPETRADVREDNPRARAAARAAQLRDHMKGAEDAPDEFFIDGGMVPDGWTYEWKRRTVMGAEDPSYQVQLARGGWEPVPADRHPEFMPRGWRGKEIERKGMVLMERPAEITADVRARERKAARGQVQAKEEQLNAAPPGQFDRVDQYGKPMAKVSKTYEAIPVPE